MVSVDGPATAQAAGELLWFKQLAALTLARGWLVGFVHVHLSDYWTV